MTASPDLSFRKLEPSEIELALSLAESDNPEDSETESFGATRLKPPLPGEAWGLWIKGTISGACWLRITPATGMAEVVALALPRGWRRLGLATWMLSELTSTARAAGCREMLVVIDQGGRPLGSVLAEAGFSGPDIVADDYPIGRWSKPCR